LQPKKIEPDPAWNGAGKTEGIQIWRIENFLVKPWPKEQYGQFYGGDSYILLRSYKNGSSMSYDLHFWLGDTTSQDEAGTAAYKTVELDDSLGGVPVQYREVQGSESQKFHSYFPQGIRILAGGVESGFHHVTPENYKPKLLHINGTMKATTIQEVELDKSSLNSEDVFILDNGLEVFQWNGKTANAGERMKGGQVLEQLNHERNGRVKHVVLEEDDKEPKFWALLGTGGGGASGGGGAKGGKTEIAAKSVHRQVAVEKCVYKLSDASGKLTLTQVCKGKISKDKFNPNDVFIVDNGMEVFAWIGSKASKQEKQNALVYAEHYLVEHNRPHSTPIAKVVQGHENAHFNKAFH